MTTNVELAQACVHSIDRGYACAIRAGRNEAMAPKPDCGGKSIREMAWGKLVEAIDPLMPGGDLEGADSDGWPIALQRGTCLGMAEVIAIFENPYNPNVDAVREEAVRRWETQNAG